MTMMKRKELHDPTPFPDGATDTLLQWGGLLGEGGRKECKTDRTTTRPKAHFLSIPTELRLRIYSLLLPDQRVPAYFEDGIPLRSDGSEVQTSVLRVNRQVYEEASSTLYGDVPFQIIVAPRQIVFCNDGFGKNPHDGEPTPGDSFRDAWLDGLAREERRNRQSFNHQLFSSLQNCNPMCLVHSHQPSPCRESLSSEGIPVWSPPIAEANFSKIRSFHVVVLLYIPDRDVDLETHGLHDFEDEGDTIHLIEDHEVFLYSVCDALHALVGRLELIQPHIRELQISMQLGNLYQDPVDVLAAAQLLLRPLSRLREITIPHVHSIVFNHYSSGTRVGRGEPVDLMQQGLNYTFENYLQRWKCELTSKETPSCPRIVYATCSLILKLLNIIMECGALRKIMMGEPRCWLFHAAKVAREASDLEALEYLFQNISERWENYLDSERRFQQQCFGLLGETSGTLSAETGNQKLANLTGYAKRAAADLAANTHPGPPRFGQYPVISLYDIFEPGGLIEVDATAVQRWGDDEGSEYTKYVINNTSRTRVVRQLLTPLLLSSPREPPVSEEEESITASPTGA